MRDEIIEELWQIKDDIAREHGYDLRAMAAYFQDLEQKERDRTRDVNAGTPTGQTPEPAKPDPGAPS